MEDKNYAIVTTRTVLRNLAKIIAPFAPFLADYLWLRLRREGDQESVHLEKWPELKEGLLERFLGKKNDILDGMALVREIVSLAMEARVSAGLKVRQPLASMLVIGSVEDLDEEYKEIIADELNIKKVYLEKDLEKIDREKYDSFNFEEIDRGENRKIMVLLDKNLTPELKKEGDFREFLRQIQIMRKKAGLQVDDMVEIKVDLQGADRDFIEDNLDELQRVAGVKKVNYGEIDGEDEVKVNDKKIKLVLID